VSVLVLALGNPLRGDDAAAAAAVEGLARDGLRVLAVHQLTPELADDVAAAQRVVFVDARAGAVPGAVETVDLRPAAGGPVATHALAPGALMALAAALHGAAPPARLVTVGAQAFTLGEPVSPIVTGALPALRAAVLAAAEG